MFKHTSVKETEPVNHQGRPWVHFPLLLSTFGQSSTTHRRKICFLFLLSTSVQTASGESEACFHPWATPWALPSVVWAVGSTPAEPLQAGEVLGGSTARMWCCAQGCRGFHGHCLLNVSDADSGEGEVVTHRSKGWASPWDWKVQKARVLLYWVTKSLSCWEIWQHTSRQSRSAG